MNTAIDTAAVIRSLRVPEPEERGAAFLEALGWSSRDAAVHWPSTPRAPGRFVLDGLPTEAGIDISSPQPDPHTAWMPGWLAGHRWSLVPGAGAVWWFDLNADRAWSARADDGDLRPLVGLTPEGFRRCGRFEPRADLTRQKKFHEHPSRYLVKLITEWWQEYYGTSKDSPQEQTEAKESFVEFLAGLLLLRTIEDLDRVSWLPPGTLAQAAKVTGKLNSLFAQAADQLNSRVLHGIAGRQWEEEIWRRIVAGTYDIDVDFSALDVDPVGAFYEEVIGTGYGRSPKRQGMLFGPDMEVEEDPNARRQRGVYYTPRAYADTLATLLVRPQAHTAAGPDDLPRVLDLAAGSGELLCAALREILAEPAWREPDVALHVLDRGIHAVDISPVALQLCALNLLRTAIRHVPELLNRTERLPPLERNLVRGDALSPHVLGRLPEADVVVINPPFHGSRYWQLESTDSIPELTEGSLPNQALAFTVAATRCLRPGGGLGVILPSQLLDGVHSTRWRRLVADRVALDLVVANYANPFPDVQSYAGMIVGYRSGNEGWRPPTRIVRIEGGLRHNTADIGALLADAGRDQPLVESKLGPAIDETTHNWLQALCPPAIGSAGRKKVPLATLLGSRNAIHHGVVLAPKPWGRDLFLFDQRPDGRLRHRASGKILSRGESASFRAVAWANLLQPHVPVWCEPEPKVRGVLVFHPGDGVSPIPLDSLRESDLVAHEAGVAIREHVLAAGRDGISSSGVPFVEDIENGKLRLYLPKGYRQGPLPRLIFARASRSSVGRKKGLIWSSWLNLDGSVVPVAGAHLVTQHPEHAAAIATWLCVEKAVSPLLRRSPARHLGTTEPRLADLAAWEVPDLRSDRFGSRLANLYDAFLDYREEVNLGENGRPLTPENAAALPIFGEVLDLGRALWEHP